MVDIHEVTLAYRRLVGPPKVAVSGLTLHLESGEIHALLGPNRAGKTTLVRALVGLLKPVSGSITVDGLDPALQRRQIAARTGTLLDGGRMLPPRWTGLEVLIFAGILHGFSFDEAKHRGQGLLERFGLADVAYELTNKYSRGMRQRLSLAAAFVHHPNLLILDEPTLGLDAESARDLRQSLLTLRREGKTILLTTHEMSLVEALADRVSVLNHGHLVATGSVPDVVAAMGARQRVHVVLSAVPRALMALPEVQVEGHTIHLPLDSSVLSRFFATLGETEAQVANVTSDSGLDSMVAGLGGGRG